MIASVIIPVFRHWNVLSLCLKCLEAQSFPAEQFEIIVVNNDPSAPPPSDFSLPSNARLIEEPQKGSYAARNAGLAVARGDVLCFTDADCQPGPKWLETAVSHLQNQDGPARIGGPIELIMSQHGRSWSEVYEKLTAFNQRRYIEGFHWSATANMCTNAATFDLVGPFDTSRFTGGDSEWGRRAQVAGVPITFVEDLCVGHPSRATFRALSQKARRKTGGKVLEKANQKGRLRYTAEYLLGLPFRFIPPIVTRFRFLRRTDAPLTERLQAYVIFYLLRVVRNIETGRILLLGFEPENR